MTDEVKAEEQEIAADEKAIPEMSQPAANDEPETKDYIEFVGWPPYGTEFTIAHNVPRKHMADVHDIKTTKDLVWTKGANGRMLLAEDDMDPAVVDYLITDPAFKRVTL